MPFHNAELFPLSANINIAGNLEIGGCDTVSMAQEFGTPLYVYDESTIRSMAKTYLHEFSSRYPDTTVAYASKAFLNKEMSRIANEEGLSLDVVSGGEIAVAVSTGFPAERMYFHGNNKTLQELSEAINVGIGTIVVDGFQELDLLNEIAKGKGMVQGIMLRLSPSVDAHTHGHTTTGILDVKFGFSIESGEGTVAIRQALGSSNLDLKGIHFHLGSPIFELEPYSEAIDTVLEYLVQFKDAGLNLREFSPGGGFAIGYVRNELPPKISQYAEIITSMLKIKCKDLGYTEPKLIIEPGRSIVGRAGVALYTVGVIKEIPTVRTYVSLDGGMGDNIRPALYGSKYEAVAANKMFESGKEKIVTLAGKYCESGDLLVKDVPLPVLEPGDIVAIPSSGAYCLAMSSNYNMNPRPAVVMVENGKSRLIRRRETYEDLMALDI
ncbi:MAG: diaminopimelate decarboxylase [SAR202 cluster bacterium]|nr:diaminopimelate decarboxylase [SAR202 cluster bacterium]HAE32435.1 diaminopimelate decarboxylase [Dehalococcoidia bacterium]|tara:strand:- start:4402 stop:5715 length:1314 start_codon:yes stop_codon:yes gene_type:complete